MIILGVDCPWYRAQIGIFREYIRAIAAILGLPRAAGRITGPKAVVLSGHVQAASQPHTTTGDSHTVARSSIT